MRQKLIEIVRLEEEKKIFFGRLHENARSFIFIGKDRQLAIDKKIQRECRGVSKSDRRVIKSLCDTTRRVRAHYVRMREAPPFHSVSRPVGAMLVLSAGFYLSQLFCFIVPCITFTFDLRDSRF